MEIETLHQDELPCTPPVQFVRFLPLRYTMITDHDLIKVNLSQPVGDIDAAKKARGRVI